MGPASRLAAGALALAAAAVSAAVVIPRASASSSRSADARGPLAAPGPNEPAGLKLLTRRSFDRLEEEGWTNRGGGAFSIVADPTAPESPPNVGQALFHAGFRSGSGPISTSFRPATAPTDLYLSFWVKLSPNWVGNDAGVNKVLFVWMHGNPVVALSAQGQGRERLEPQVRLQNTPMGARNLRPNLDRSAEIRRGKWQRWEVRLVANGPGRADGEVRWWIDGRPAGRHEGLVLAGAGEARDWSRISWNPTYGGKGRPVPADQTMRMDGIYVSGR